MLGVAVASIPAGRYAVAVSGGADSVALFRLLLEHRRDIHLHVVHLDHQTRAGESGEDARFVRKLAEQFSVPCAVARRQEIEPLLGARPGNKSAFFRALRHELFRRATQEHKLDAVLLAHHAGDQAETIFQRLVRGPSLPGLGGMRCESELSGFRAWRPLLTCPPVALRDYLRSIGQVWREDSSNESDDYLRNRVRKLLGRTPQLAKGLIELGNAARGVGDWVRRVSPRLETRFRGEELVGLPEMVAAEACRGWLERRGGVPGRLSGDVLRRFLSFATDAACPAQISLPGGLAARRERGIIRIAGAEGD
jgi:tRNA(Ile)-lysidine synthase